MVAIPAKLECSHDESFDSGMRPQATYVPPPTNQELDAALYDIIQVLLPSCVLGAPLYPQDRNCL